ncbi:hypothetical protein GOV05_00170 [Candidatus Woesearchaeota archaeon]|nr:hypothetical protein [Candidatus Woesearchaeota archaeon]
MISKKTKGKVLFWTPRSIVLLFIAFISVFALDVFSESYSSIELVMALLMHLTPSILLGLILFLVWKHPKIASVAFLGIALIFTIFFNTYKDIASFLILSLPLLIISFLFFLDYKYNK